VNNRLTSHPLILLHIYQIHDSSPDQLSTMIIIVISINIILIFSLICVRVEGGLGGKVGYERACRVSIRPLGRQRCLKDR